MKETATLQIKGFPIEVSKALKIKSIREGVSFRELVIRLLSEGAK